MRVIGIALLFVFAACHDESEADRLGIGAQCTATDECDEDTNQECLTNFAGGYCGIEGCLSDADCVEDSACIAHTDGHNYCFRTCIDKPDCNDNRDVENESNCSSSVDFVDGANGRKACVPPSSGV
jgi:hypothetical protein